MADRALPVGDRDVMRVVVTAGHVDHGKSSVLRALTGMEPDRYEEERRRGLTIDLGFVWAPLPSGRGVAFVDVPGHARLIRTMLAGAGAVDLCLFVVAATEGWMPQSEEHLRILEQVGAVDGVVVLTKGDLLDGAGRAAARAALVERLDGTFLGGRPVVEVDAVHGTGIDRLAAELDALLDRAPTPPSQDRPRLWIDRSFPIRGAGTVVTGTLTGGEIAVGDALDAVDGRGRTIAVRVRGLQSQERDRLRAGPGQRVAANLVGVHHDELGRGSVLVRGDQWRPTSRFDAAVRVLDGAELRNRGALLAYVGTNEQPVRLRVLGRDRVGPGESGVARLWLPHALPLVAGDRFVLRDTGRDRTVAGGEVLDVHPVRPVSTARPDRSVDRVIAERGWVDLDDLEALTGARRRPTVGRWVVDPGALAVARREVVDLVAAAGPAGVELAVLDDRQRALLPLVEGVVVELHRVWLAAATVDWGAHPWLRALEAVPFAPEAEAPPPGEVAELVRRGLVVCEDGVYFAIGSVELARRYVAAALAELPDGLTLGEIRDLLGTSRRCALAVAGLLDRRGATTRRGDVRVAGPRLDRVIGPQPR